MNPVIPDEIADTFLLSVKAYDLGRRGFVAAVMNYRAEFGHTRGFSVEQMYKDFSDLTRMENGMPRVSARTIRYYVEAVTGLPDGLQKEYESEVLTFEHCAVDRRITNEQGLERGYTLEWALTPYRDDGAKPRTAAEIERYFLPNADRSDDEIFVMRFCDSLGYWQRRADALNGSLPNKERVLSLIGELVALLNGKNLPEEQS